MNIIRLFEDVDFSVLGDETGVDDENITFHFEPRHGTVAYMTGLFEDPDVLACMGSEDGKTFQFAFIKEFREFEKGWYRLIGREDKLREIELSDECGVTLIE